MNMDGEQQVVDDVSNDELGLGPSDPLTILLNNLSDSETCSSQASSPPDWSQFSSLWPQQPLDDQNTKFPDLGGSFDFSFPMDLDLNAALSMAVDPSTLHYHGTSPETVFDMNSIHVQPQDLLSSFPFTFSSPTLSSASASASSADEKSPRMSVSSGTSVSPVMVPMSSGTDPFSGVVMHAKLPIPRLISSIAAISSSKPPKHKPVPQPYLSSSASSSPSPGPTTPTSDSGSSAHNPQIVGATVISRPKTSHTTIERRYRTNLNARIQSLKAAVPALRVLDQNTTQEGDVVDERGYIDGVKVARKGSKANVLGKAVEYIRVLKRREIRLRREQEGLRTLILGIPGAEPLLAEWDHEWAKKFGGPERDEIDNEAEAYEGSDEEDGEDDGDDSERARKKPKLAKAPAAKKDKNPNIPTAPAAPAPIIEGIPGVAPEKRKRGRPRKVQPGAPAPIVLAAPVVLGSPVGAPVQGDVTMQAQPQQYLLAVFALFSFFNSPFTSTGASHPHTHQGSVLSHVTADSMPVAATTSWSWSTVAQAVHLLASVLVLVTIIVPWVPLPGYIQRAKIMRIIPFSYLIYSQAALVTQELVEPPSPPLSPDNSDSDSDGDSTSTERTTRQEQSKGPLSDALAQRGCQDECEALIDALGLSTGALGAVRSIFTRRTVIEGSDSELERRSWVRLAELVALHPSSVPALLRLQVYLRLSSSLGASGNACDLATLALLAHSLPLIYVQDRSQKLWNRARVGLVRPYERLVLETLSLDAAAKTLASTPPASSLTPLGALATILLRQRLNSHTSDLFVQTVTRSHTSTLSQSNDTEQEAQWHETINAGRSLGGTISAISDSFAKVWESGVLNVKDLVVDDEDIKTVLSTVVLFRRIFPSRILCCDTENNEVSVILSPPPSPPARGPQKEVVMQLRRALGSSVFEEQSEDRDELEDARDRAVDMLVEYERRGRSRV